MELARKANESSFASTFSAVRAATEALCEGLTAEDCNLQAMPETSPAKWHLAHTTWFFETFVLESYAPGYVPVNPLYRVLFNSYYNGIGAQYPRPQRGLLSRPSLDEVYDYRHSVTSALVELLDQAPRILSDDQHQQMLSRVELGLHHEAQHQELLLTDLKYSFFQNPLFPVYCDADPDPAETASQQNPVPLRMVPFEGGRAELGAIDEEFAFDNELPRHPVVLAPYALANRLVTNGEYLQFIEAGGYENPEYWLSDGWAALSDQSITQPLYWGRVDGQWVEYTLHGLTDLDPLAPVSHVSYYEAQAYAAWSGKRLSTEAEWEHVARSLPYTGQFVESGTLHPQAAVPEGDIVQMFGGCWQWTQSAYLPYPGFRPAEQALGEYNGKFMSGQMVLRGGSCLSAAFHVRSTYRNFFYPPDRWQCTGIRLAEDL